LSTRAFPRLVFVVFASACVLCERAHAHDGHDAAAIDAASGAVERGADRLILHLRSGKTRELKDGNCKATYGTPDCLHHVYELHEYDRDRGVFVVAVACDECNLYLIIDDRSGLGTYFDSVPAFSPSGDVALEVVTGEQDYVRKRQALKIWQRLKRKFRLAWSRPIPAGSSYTVRAVAEDRIDIDETTGNGAANAISIARHGASWHTPKLKVSKRD